MRTFFEILLLLLPNDLCQTCCYDNRWIRELSRCYRKSVLKQCEPNWIPEAALNCLSVCRAPTELATNLQTELSHFHTNPNVKVTVIEGAKTEYTVQVIWEFTQDSFMFPF